MPAAISITDEDFAYAERILLPAGESFDEERRRFIRNFETIDLQAVPGSGKTTALLAKLLILDRRLPFHDGFGILVLSHTNAAIDEIKGKIGSHCSNLFRYPNFVGTIQSFVDEFLAVPFYTNRYKKPPIRIDDDIYNQRFSKSRYYFPQLSTNVNHYLIANSLSRYANPKNIRWSFIDGKACLTDGYCGNEIDIKKPRGRTKPQNFTDWSDQEKEEVRKWLRGFKNNLLKDGYLCFDDAYFLANVFLSKNKHIKSLLQLRFAYVFVDEMQDMEQHQYELLESVFFDAGTSLSRYQRIGDKNQSIFGESKDGAQDYWNDRTTVLELNGSYRLSAILASVVEPFAVSPIRIEGRRKSANGTDMAIKPHLIVFTDATKESVIQRFAEIVKALIEEEKIPQDSRNKYKAVAWVAKEKEKGKLRLCDYHPNYSKEERAQRIDYENLKSYIANYNKDDRTLSSIEKNISHALLRILREEKVVDALGNPFSKRKLIEFLKENKPEYWAAYEIKLYAWCLDVARGKAEEALIDIRTHIPAFLSQFCIEVENSGSFINDTKSDAVPSPNNLSKKPANIVRLEEIDIDITTVHRVKGETHTATLYLETFYQRCHESDRLEDALKGIAIETTAHKYVKQSAQMVYVGFSRPTHLLCFAVHESRFSKLEAGINLNVWKIERLVEPPSVTGAQSTRAFNNASLAS